MFAEIGDPVTFEWQYTGSDITMLILLIEYPDGSQAYVTREPTKDGKDSLTLSLDETGDFKWSVWPQINDGEFVETEWISFSIAATLGKEPEAGSPVVPQCGESMARYTERHQDLHKAVGRILFRYGEGNFLCTGTLVEGNDDRAIIATAAHCVFDSDTKTFPDYVMFIPGQDDGGTDGSDYNCNNDPHGCFYPTFGVISEEYTTKPFMKSFQYDYGFYVAPDTDNGNDNAPDASSYAGPGKVKSLKPMGITFSGMAYGANTFLFGYPGSQDPKFMYTEGVAEESPVTDGGWYVDCSGLTGGASGGPWTQSDPTTGQMVVASVNSWGWGNGSTGMGSPPYDVGAECVYNAANSADMASGYFTAVCPA
jgi:hypothetical protein